MNQNTAGSRKVSTCMYNTAKITSDVNKHGSNAIYPNGGWLELVKVWLLMITY